MGLLTIDRLVEIYRSLEETEISSDREVSGVEKRKDIFLNLESELTQNNILVHAFDSRCKLTFGLSCRGKNFFARNINELISVSDRVISPPEKFYIADLDYFYSAEEVDNIPCQVSSYLNVCKLARIFDKISDAKNFDRFYLFHKEKIEIYIQYDTSKEISIDRLEYFISTYIADTIHCDQKLSIIKDIILEMFVAAEKNISLGYFAENFDIFLERVESNYNLYVSEFSFQKVKSEIENSKSEFIIKINKVFSDIQNQMLAVPAALVIVNTQYTEAPELFAKNLSLIIGAFVFAIFTWLLIKNQRNTLLSIKGEVEKEFEKIKKEHYAIKDYFDGPYILLRKRFLYQYAILDFVSFVIVVLFLTTFCAFLKYSSLLTSYFPVFSIILFIFLLLLYLAGKRTMRDKPWMISF